MRPLQSSWIAALLIVAVAVATRVVAWHNPIVHVDDQFYLLAGEEMLTGHWPYIDFWDRKPPGLFLLYAGLAWIGGGSILGLNLVATAFAAATAWVIRQTALRFASPPGATLGALAYLFVIPLVGGQTGQSPVFYNLFMAGAAWLLVDAAEAEAQIARRALAAMLLCGLAMTVKQVSFIEGGYFGLAFLWLLHRRGAAPASLASTAAAMIAVALLPTALTVLPYALTGQVDAYVFATITSIFLKSGWSWITKVGGIIFFLFHLTPLLLMAIAGVVMRRRDPERTGPADALLAGWIVAALVGYVAIPHFFYHYALPVVVPLGISAATLFGRRTGPLFFAALAIFCLAGPIRDVAGNRLDAQEFARLAAAVDQARHGGCLYVADGPTRLYSVSQACRTTRYLFPDHLNSRVEVGAVGIDARAELARILARRPAVIVTLNDRMVRYSPAYLAFLDQVERDYRPTFVSHASRPTRVERFRVWQRKDLPPPARSS